MLLQTIEFGEFAWWIAYDIADPRRLGRIHWLIKNVAIPIQYSVFLTWLNDGQVANLEARICSRIDPIEDDVRLYHLPCKTTLASLGKPWWPDGVQLLRRGQPVQLEFPSIGSLR